MMTVLNYRKYRNLQISDMIDCGFRYWKTNTLCLNYSLDEYQQRIITKNLKFFHNKIFKSLNAWITIGFLLAMICKSLNKNIIIGNEYFKQMIDCERSDLLFLFAAIAYTILELMWLHLF